MSTSMPKAKQRRQKIKQRRPEFKGKITVEKKKQLPKEENSKHIHRVSETVLLMTLRFHRSNRTVTMDQ